MIIKTRVQNWTINWGLDTNPESFRDNIKAKAIREAAEDIADTDENQTYIADEIGRLANQFSYFMSAEDAIEKATDLVEERKIRIGNFYIDRYSTSLPNEDQLEAINEKYIDDFMKNNPNTEFDDDEISFVPLPNSENNLWAVQHPNLGIVLDDEGNTKIYSTDEVFDSMKTSNKNEVIKDSAKLNLKAYRTLFNRANADNLTDDNVILDNGQTVGEARKQIFRLREILKNTK